MTSRFQSTIPAGQRCILQYMLPWLANIELVDLVNPPSIPTLEIDHEQDEDSQSEIVMPIELNGEGWGSFEATRLVLNNLFYITVKVCLFICAFLFHLFLVFVCLFVGLFGLFVCSMFICLFVCLFVHSCFHSFVGTRNKLMDLTLFLV